MPENQLNVVYMGEWLNTSLYPYNDEIGATKVPLVQYNGNYYLANSQPAVGDEPGVAATWSEFSTGGGSTIPPLPNANIFVGNASNQATAVPVTGDITLANTGAVSLVNSSVTGQVLTGFTSATGTITATDTILTAIQKVDGNTQALATLPAANILVGNASNIATAVPMSGAVSIDNAGATTLDNTSVTGQVLTGLTTTAGSISATDTILSAIGKSVGNLAASSTYTAGTGTPQINFKIDNVAGIVKFDIWDSVNFATINNSTVTFTYNLPTLPDGLTIDNIISVTPTIQTAALNSLVAATGTPSAWSNSVSTSAIGICAINTTGTPINDGSMWITIEAKLN